MGDIADQLENEAIARGEWPDLKGVRRRMAATQESAHEILTKPFPPNKVKQKRGQGNRTMNYISHGLVTERLNEADPNWSSEVLKEHTYMDANGRLHCEGVTIKLTVNGVTRVEAGGPQRQDGFTNEIKNAYSDALKRAAMRFGVALEMWESLLDAEGDEDYEPLRMNDDSTHTRQAPQNANGAQYNWQDFWTWARSQNLGSPQAIEGVINQPISGMSPNQIRDAIQLAQTQQRPVQAPQNGNGQQRPQAGPGPITDPQKKFLWRLTQQMGWDENNLRSFVAEQFQVEHVGDLSKQQATALIDMLKMELEGPAEQGSFQGMPAAVGAAEDAYVN